VTVISPPPFMQVGSLPAKTLRQLLAAHLTSPLASFAGGVGALDPGHGVVLSGDLAVTQNGTPNMSVNVAAGSAFIKGTSAADQGVYGFFNDATVNLAISTSDPTNGRRDLIIAQIRDAGGGYGGVDNDARLAVVTGTASGSPVDPAVPANCLVLARITVDAAAGSIVTGKITDLRTRAIGRGAVLGSAAVTASQGSLGAGPTDLTGLSVTVNVCANRRIRVRAAAVLRNGESAANSGQLLIVADGTTIRTAPSGLVSTASTGVKEYIPAEVDITAPSAGSHTYKLQSSFANGSANLMEASATQPATLVVEDLGPI
jgi:hypothetical protein